MIPKLWRIMPAVPADVQAALGEFTPVGAQLLYNRGITDSEVARAYLESSPAGWPDPFLLPDMKEAVARALQARERRETVTVYGDYDADGISGSALLVQGLRTIGIEADIYIPDRNKEGYGLSRAAIEALLERGSGLVITVDSGTSALDEIGHAASLGVDVVVLDHHAIPQRLPAAPVVNAHRPESRYPFEDFCGAGVAFKFLQALYQTCGRSQDDLLCYADLAAIGTVADLTPLEGENRRLVREGLVLLNTQSRPGLAALMQRAGLKPGQVDARDLAFMVAPRINAMGRLEHALASYRLLVTQNVGEANELADLLDSTNRTRQALTVELVERARSALADDPTPNLVFVSGPDYPVGMVGLVAGRLAEDRYRPAVVVEEGAVMSRGSARSIPGVSIIDVLRDCDDLMTRYGGHPQAAGFTIETARLPALRDRLNQAAERALDGQDPQPVITVDMVTRLRTLPGPAMKILASLAPFGAGNPEPNFLSRGVQVVKARTLGRDSSHLELTVKEDGAVWRAMGFGMGQRLPEASGQLDVVYGMGLDRLAGNGLLQLRLQDFRPTLAE